MTENLLPLFQLCDSTFPTGAFSHSFGMETYIQKNKIHDQKTFMQWVTTYVNEQLAYSDGIACKICYEALETREQNRIWDMDQLLYAQNIPEETREGTRMIGERMLSLVNTLYDIPLLSEYADRIRDQRASGHPAIVFTVLSHHLGVSSNSTILYYLYSSVSSLVQNAVRSIPLGQTAGQKVIQELQPVLMETTKKIQQLDIEDFGAVSPGLELAQMQHERVGIRIFMS
ncbi:urease accessory protein UreF [Sporosarcina sp. 179-K 8C2 HS]|uniref:urease accessory protein UreF n=1 Tax=Sporosarcina sp. 179-K 8C2 HS TaxID=3142387 RepID=UPI0039A0C679